MKELKKLIPILVAAIAVILVLIIVVRLIKGAFSLAGGLLNTVLGIVLILALVILVCWMFSYAKKKKK